MSMGSLRDRWARAWTGWKWQDQQDQPRGNLMGSGGQGHRRHLYCRKWIDIAGDVSPHLVLDTRSAQEWLFFAYFAPLEHWCDMRLQHPYYLWSDNWQVSLLLTSDKDRMYYQLRWGDRLPPYRELCHSGSES